MSLLKRYVMRDDSGISSNAIEQKVVRGERFVRIGDQDRHIMLGNLDHDLAPMAVDVQVPEADIQGGKVDFVLSAFEASDRVVSAVFEEDECVGTAATNEQVVPFIANQYVSTCAAFEYILSGATFQNILTVISVKPIIAFAAIQNVIAAIASESIIPGATKDVVVAAFPKKPVIAVIAKDLVIPSATHQRVIAIKPDQLIV